MRNYDAEGYVPADEARARRLGIIHLLELEREGIADELGCTVAEALDWLALDDGRYVVRVEGVPVLLADLSSLDADATLRLVDLPDAVREDDESSFGHETDSDCFGELRCVECDGPCPGCYDGGGPDSE